MPRVLSGNEFRGKRSTYSANVESKHTQKDSEICGHFGVLLFFTGAWVKVILREEAKQWKLCYKTKEEINSN